MKQINSCNMGNYKYCSLKNALKDKMTPLKSVKSKKI